MWTDGCRVAVAPGPLSPKCWDWWNPGLGNVWALSTLRVTPLALPGLLRWVLPCVPWTLLYPQPFLVVCDAVGSCHPCCEKLLDPSGSDTAAFGHIAQKLSHRSLRHRVWVGLKGGSVQDKWMELTVLGVSREDSGPGCEGASLPPSLLGAKMACVHTGSDSLVTCTVPFVGARQPSELGKGPRDGAPLLQRPEFSACLPCQAAHTCL